METLLQRNLFKQMSSVNTKIQSLVFNLLPAALSDVPFHENTTSIARIVAAGFPLHLAVHKVSPVLFPPKEYTQPHVHEDTDEVNIILSEKHLLYKFHLGSETFTVSSNSSIWIPRGMIHAANVLAGSGYFITLRIR